MKNPWVAWYPGDYINKTRHLSMAQHGAYMLLLWEYYINGPLVANATGLLNVCCGRTEADEVDINYVLERFFVLKDGFWHHERADEEIERRLTKRKHLQLNGGKGGVANASRLLEQKGSKSLACSQSQSQSHKPRSKAKATSAFALPDWVPQEAWNHYEEMRQRIRKPMTDQARKWAVDALAKLRVKGFDPAEVLEQSVFNSWQGLFEVKHDRNAQTERRKTADNSGGAGRPSTQVTRAYSNLASVASGLTRSDRVAQRERGSGMEHRALTDGSGQEA